MRAPIAGRSLSFCSDTAIDCLCVCLLCRSSCSYQITRMRHRNMMRLLLPSLLLLMMMRHTRPDDGNELNVDATHRITRLGLGLMSTQCMPMECAFTYASCCFVVRVLCFIRHRIGAVRSDVLGFVCTRIKRQNRTHPIVMMRSYGGI